MTVITAKGTLNNLADTVHLAIPNLFAYKKLKLDSFQLFLRIRAYTHPWYAGRDINHVPGVAVFSI
jgi:hypothetical protein